MDHESERVSGKNGRLDESGFPTLVFPGVFDIEILKINDFHHRN